ncbi:GNAT family N-acetyltransferase [Paraflavitalea speifideaquila]|uniref:GNAT family N-acetyltransferase n=1 Tax=Paraflavitalea speifideaquila TaxID=3076558 RepID=UPI0028EBCCD4|nr:GNAT family N-acetyltransferase [Paraflavitalea speifideiaquila]
MNDELIIRSAGIDDLPAIGYLAQQIWPGTYGSILSAEQLKYMMDLIYSPDSLQQQMVKHKHIFLIAELDEEPVGFASYSPLKEPGVYKLHKLYVHPKTQGKGIGKTFIDFIIDQLPVPEATTLRLNVNRHNKARQFYEKLGFVVTKEEDIDIGHQYYMNDFVMERNL